MLIDRVKNTGAGFTINPEEGQERRVYYGTYSFRDAPDYVPEELAEGYYWRSMIDSNENRLDVLGDHIGSLLYIEERINGKIVDECRICLDKNNKVHIGITFGNPPRGFKRNSCMVSFEWEKWDGMPVNAGYFCLVDRNQERYPFLRKTIRPQEKKGKLEADRFIFEMSDGCDMDDYGIIVDALLREKYNISIYK